MGTLLPAVVALLRKPDFLKPPSESKTSVAQTFVGELLGRSDYAIIGELIEPNTRVLDLGCGEGELLAWLATNKRVDARGVEISGPKAQQAISHGVSVVHSDL